MKTTELYDLSKTIAKPLLESAEYPWQILGKIKEFIISLGETLDKDKFDQVSPQVWIA